MQKTPLKSKDKFKVYALEDKDSKLLRSAMIELALAVSKMKQNEAARYHMEVFWSLIENKTQATRS